MTDLATLIPGRVCRYAGIPEGKMLLTLVSGGGWFSGHLRLIYSSVNTGCGGIYII